MATNLDTAAEVFLNADGSVQFAVWKDADGTVVAFWTSKDGLVKFA